MIENIVNNPYLSGIIILITQIVFLYFRTLNVIYTADRKILGAILTGNMIGISWLISITLGVNAIMNFQWQPIFAHILGGSLGTYWGFMTNKKKIKNEH